MARKKDFQLSFIDTKPEITLLLIHGFPLNSMMWWPQLNGLDRVARVIAPDLRGFGRSEPGGGKPSVRQYAEDCKQLLDRLNVTEPVVVCGMSMGGYVAFEFYRRYPKLVRGLILTSTKAAADDLEGKVARDRSIEIIQKNGVEAVTKPMSAMLLSNHHYNRNDELLLTLGDIMETATEEGAIDALAAMRDRPDSTSDLEKIAVPTLIIHGLDDKIVPVKEARIMDELIPNCHLEFVPRSGHLCNLEEPKVWNGIATSWLQELLD